MLGYKLNEKFELNFKVVSIKYRNNDNMWSIIKPKITSHGLGVSIPYDMTIQGVFPSLFKGDTFKGVGRVMLNDTYGYSIKLDEIPSINMPQENKAIALFLKKRIKGLGLKKAIEIVKVLGADCISIIEKDYKSLLSIDGIGEKKAKKIYEEIMKHKSFEELSTFLQANKVEGKLGLLIYEVFGEDSLKRIMANPYAICSINDIKFSTADKIAKSLGFNSNYKYRVTTSIMEFLSNKIISGDILTYQKVIYSEINDFLKKNGSFDKVINEKHIDKALEYLLDKELIIKEIDENGENCIYRKDYNIIENKIIENIDKLLNTPKPILCSKYDIDRFITDFEKNNFKLDIKQQEAVYMALLNGISILIGLPGTGKTLTTNIIVQCIKAVNPHATITLLAPTGKASRRVEEVTNMEASTIHRCMNINYGDYANISTLDSDYVIVDESSMIDAYLFEKLTSNISANTRLFLVGDYDQLPSVGAGLVLRDLVNSKAIPVTNLTNIFRQAKHSNIVLNANKIIKKEVDKLTFTKGKNGDFYFNEIEDIKAVRDNIIALYENARDKGGFNIEEISILSPVNIGDLGTIELNKLVQEKINPQSSNPEYVIDDMNVLRVGDKVIHTRNNYDLNVMNGDVGIIKNIYTIDDEFYIDVKYNNKKRPVTYDEMSILDIDLAYAITVHKSQGSEYPVVIMPIHKSIEMYLDKNMLNTAWTRAKKMVVCVGTKESIKNSINHSLSNRVSRVQEKLRNL